MGMTPCDSCGADSETLYPVRRTYLTPAGPDSEATSRTLDEVESWCFACCTSYPHEAA